ncbi:haloacid dehalogenase-like hydrolase [Diplodia corticola]|uniref:Haloacid dehalogenase-like hydrolase n=1 Tax=Diplodia corticola TaxID=236234 RepID=A0A1J9SDZ2_9PEZI|nr:haloacid dehalogenase-like hydrolase [Diplodia corticola]OJD38052.1 haloacid dehalogenase-like hydrolase [Diplodia corticola]
MAEQTKKLPAIRACLFDMDGLLIDSEDLYTICTNAVLREYGKPDLPWSIKAQMQGRPGPQAAAIFHAFARLPITHDEFMAKQGALQREHFPKAQPLPGVVRLLDDLTKRTGGAKEGEKEGGDSKKKKKKVHVALATSSHAGNYALKTAHLPDLFAVFPDENRVLGDDARIEKGRGKPLPDIYLLALETVNARLRREGAAEEDLVRPEECLVFEDSVPGVEAGRRAGMQVVWCPHPGLAEEYRGREGEVLAGRTGEHKGLDDERSGRVGEIGDGWAVHLESLVDFPYERFGIEVV